MADEKKKLTKRQLKQLIKDVFFDMQWECINNDVAPFMAVAIGIDPDKSNFGKPYIVTTKPDLEKAREMLLLLLEKVETDIKAKKTD